MIVDGRKYVAWWSFVSKVAWMQSFVLKESNVEADFCSSMTPYGWAFGVEEPMMSIGI